MRPIRVTILGVSADLGLMAKTRCHPKHSWELWFFLLTLFPAIILWFLTGLILRTTMIFSSPRERREKQRILSHKIFNFMLSEVNFYDYEDGFFDRIRNEFRRPLAVTNLSRIGYSFRQAYKHSHLIPQDQDLFFIDLGVIDYMSNTSCAEFRHLVRNLLRTIAERNHKAHIHIFGLPDLVAMVGSDRNKEKVINVPFAPSIASLQALEGFHKHKGLSVDSSLSEKVKAYRLLRVFSKIIHHELKRAHSRKILSSISFVDALDFPIYRPEDRSKYFAIDAIHFTPESVKMTVNAAWPRLEKPLYDILQMGPNMTATDETDVELYTWHEATDLPTENLGQGAPLPS